MVSFVSFQARDSLSQYHISMENGFSNPWLFLGREKHTVNAVGDFGRTLVVCGGYTKGKPWMNCAQWQNGMTSWTEYARLRYFLKFHFTLILKRPQQSCWKGNLCQLLIVSFQIWESVSCLIFQWWQPAYNGRRWQLCKKYWGRIARQDTLPLWNAHVCIY